MKRSNRAVVLMLFSTALMAAATVAFDFKVGDEMAWQVPANNSEFYDYWASTNRFQIGDYLSFEFHNDSVLMVEKWDYYHCNSSDPIISFDKGKGIIKLDRSGPFYFISGFPDHCKNGQRLLVEVMSPHPIVPPQSSPPESFPDDTTPSPSPHNAGAAVPVTGSAVLVIMAAVVGLLLFF